MFNLIFSAGPQYKWKKVFLILVLSSIAISGSSTLGYCLYYYIKHQQIAYTTGTIQAILQSALQKDLPPLQSTYLAEVLNLSSDKPTRLAQFDINEAKTQLTKKHIFKELKLKKIKPDLLFIEYMLRTPYVFLEEYTNTVMDEEGFFFPYLPFYPPRQLPTIYLGSVAISPWGEKINPEHLQIIKQLLMQIEGENVQRIDLSQIDEHSAGKREIIIILRDGNILRLCPKDYIQQLSNYFILKSTILKKGAKIIDLRIPNIAYIGDL